MQQKSLLLDMKGEKKKKKENSDSHIEYYEYEGDQMIMNKIKLPYQTMYHLLLMY